MAYPRILPCFGWILHHAFRYLCLLQAHMKQTNVKDCNSCGHVHVTQATNTAYKASMIEAGEFAGRMSTILTQASLCKRGMLGVLSHHTTSGNVLASTKQERSLQAVYTSTVVVTFRDLSSKIGLDAHPTPSFLFHHDFLSVSVLL